MRYARIKRVKKFIYNPIVKVIFYLGAICICIVGIQHLNGMRSFLDAVLDIIKNDITASVFIIGLFAMIVNSIRYWTSQNVEESDKTESDHRRIILKYQKHGKQASCGYSDQGDFLQIFQPNLDTTRIAKNPETDPYHPGYHAWQKHYEESGFPATRKEAKKPAPEAKLTLSSISVFANNRHDPIKHISIHDNDERYSLPHYVHNNAQNLLRAHATTALKNNQTTIRLKNATYQEDTLTLFTERSTYYEMLMTNRCMDYEHHPHITLREIYEYKDRITRLEKSRMSNQIGINGLVMTSDGYYLVEKRDLSKSTWKDKFSQPISLAMKQKDIGDLLKKENSTEDVNRIFAKIIADTLKNNYNIDSTADYSFHICQNFMGLARDLLEGGKPNLYFVVKLNKTAEELEERMLEGARRALEKAGQKAGEDQPGRQREQAAEQKQERKAAKPLSAEKLKSDFYLIHENQIKIDCNYSMTLKRKDREKGWIYINRIQKPRSSFEKRIANRLRHSLYWLLHRELCKECSEALLVCIAYKQLYEHKEG